MRGFGLRSLLLWNPSWVVTEIGCSDHEVEYVENIILYSIGFCENPLTSVGRGGTIAAFHVAQSSSEITAAEMRRDILTFLMSPRAISYWLNEKKWLKKCKKVGRVEILQLTSEGLLTCINSLNGGADVSTSRIIVDRWVRYMCSGESGEGSIRKEFLSLK